MSRPAFEAFLARLYVDADFRAAFLADPIGVARAGAMNETEVAALAAIDRHGLVLASNSFNHKRTATMKKRRRSGRPP